MLTAVALQSNHCPASAYITIIIAAGANPEVTMSASESSSTPMGEDWPSRRAAKPSRKSQPESSRQIAVHEGQHSGGRAAQQVA